MLAFPNPVSYTHFIQPNYSDYGSFPLTDLQEPQAWPELAKLLNSHQRFLISSHIRPDGDAIGASLAMKRILQRLGKDVLWVMDEELSANYEIFCREGELAVFNPQTGDYTDRDAMVMVDAGEWYRLGKTGEMMRQHPGVKICIDHHIPQNDYEGLRIVDTASPSTTVLIYRFIRHLQMDFDFELAEPIYLGMIVDTQNFHLPNTTEEAHYIAAHCLRAGVKPTRVHEPVFGITMLSRLRLMSEAFHTLELHCGGKVGIMHTTRAMFRETKAESFDDDGFVDFVRTIEGVRIGVYLREESDGTVKASWRAKGENNVVVSAHKFGGGGHLRAAGATLQGNLADAKHRILEDLRERSIQGEIS
jgi:bifunctional oligoribonuclease and PAP phosphatase NrnA